MKTTNEPKRGPRGQTAKEVRAKQQKIKVKVVQRKLTPMPVETLIENELESLRSLRRRLCCYVNSDSRCDCKYLMHAGSIEKRSGEQTGCCEVRQAIGKLEIVKDAIMLARGPQPAKPKPRPEECDDCGGTGQRRTGLRAAVRSCRKCKGAGELL